MERRGIIVDLAHSSGATIREVLAIAQRPPIVSHTGLKGTCDNARNLSDDQLRSVARAGGLVGIGDWPTAVCGDTPAAVARAIRYAVGVVGDEHVALGSDFDGAVTTPFDASRIDALTEAMLDAGLPETSVRRVLGENAVALLRKLLP
jgi:microsomal dipeptidase-like Zn-dependent dipeptidase